MLKQSSLLGGHDKGLRHRVPDVIADDGERIYSKMPDAAILLGRRSRPSSNPGRRARPTPSQRRPRSPDPVFDRDTYVTLIRPDHIVGAIADPTTPDHAQFTAALGRHD
jgi:hypothetical protein